MALEDTTRAGVEDELREAMLTGQPVDWRTADAAADDPAQGASWDVQRTVAAALLIKLLTDADGARRPRALWLAGARIIGQLDLEATELVCPLLLRSCWFAEPAILDEAQAPALRLPGCHLPGLSADQLTTRRNLELNNGFTATGEVRLSGAHIGGMLEFSGATLTNPNGCALRADWLTVDQGMYCRDGFTAIGQVSLAGARISGQLDLSGATLTNPDGRALHLRELQAGTLLLRDLTEPPELVDLSGAQVGTLVDEPASWPRRAYLDGFIYDDLDERDPVGARQRLSWLARDPRGYRPRPYEQLAAVYRRAGRDDDADVVAIAKQHLRRRTLRPPEQLWGLLLDYLVGYGYRTWLRGVWLLGFWLVGWWVFDRAYASHDLVVAKPGEAHPSFHGGLYALDTLLPLVDLGQQTAWVPQGPAQWYASASILAGWVLTTAVVVGVTGLPKRD